MTSARVKAWSRPLATVSLSFACLFYSRDLRRCPPTSGVRHGVGTLGVPAHGADTQTWKESLPLHTHYTLKLRPEDAQGLSGLAPL